MPIGSPTTASCAPPCGSASLKTADSKTIIIDLRDYIARLEVCARSGDISERRKYYTWRRSGRPSSERQMSLADAPKLKRGGNALFGKGKYAEAVAKPGHRPVDGRMDRAVLYSNRSAARLKLAGEKPGHSWMRSAHASSRPPTRRDIPTRPALRALGDPVRAAEAMEKVLEIEPAQRARQWPRRAARCARQDEANGQRRRRL